MDFELPEELRIFKDVLRRFVDAEMIPVERHASTDTEKLKPEYYERFCQRAKDLGFWKMDIPEEYGGAGFSVLARSIVETELSRSVALPARGLGGITGPSVRAILYALTGEMKEKYLLPSVRGEKKACFAQTEPDAGSDPGGMRTVAVRDGAHYPVQALKRFLTRAGEADFMQLMAATDRAKGSHGGISCFIVDMNTPGVKLTTQYKTMMGDEPWEIVLENVRVPASHRVGKEGDGFGHAQQWLNAGRVRHGASALGVTELCLELATAYAKQRSTFGRPLADRQAVQWMLADMYVELQAAGLLVYKAATRLDKGEDARNDAYVCKYFADEMAFKPPDMCIKSPAATALTTNLPIEKFWRQQRSFRITEGASEVMKMVIARHVLKTYG